MWLRIRRSASMRRCPKFGIINEVFNKGGVKYPEFTFHVYLSSGMALKQEAKPSQGRSEGSG